MPRLLSRASKSHRPGPDVSMAPLEFQHMPAREYLDRYDGITSELNVNIEYDGAVDVTTTYLGHESIRITETF